MLITIIITLIIFLFIGMVALIYFNAKAEKRRKTLDIIGGNSFFEKGKGGSEQDQRRAHLARKLKESGSEEDFEKTNKLAEFIAQAGYDFSTQKFWLSSVTLSAFATFVFYIMGFSIFVMAMVAIIFFFGVPRLFLRLSAKSRQKKFMEDFADALESMTRLLKAGMPVSEAIKMVAREFSGPLGEEMDRVFDQQKIGVPLPEAILAAARRMPLPEMQMFATAVAIQAQTGSSLSEILQNLAGVIRARFRLRRKVQALSSEAKSSAMIIGALPCVVALGMYFINPEYIEILFTDPTGKFLLGGAVSWMSVGIIVMRQMINFKV